MRSIGESFAWPFRGSWRKSWIPGVVCVLFFPFTFPLVLGYSVEATRVAQRDPAAGPPAWRLSDRLVKEGAWVFCAIVLSMLPFWLLASPVSFHIDVTRVAPGVVVAHLVSAVIAGFVLALPWGVLALVWFPHATARFAATGRARDLFDVVASVRSVRREFAAWNLAAAAIVTAWAAGVACAGLLCVGLVPGVYYAILVSAHACATLEIAPRPQAASSSAAGEGGDPPAR